MTKKFYQLVEEIKEKEYMEKEIDHEFCACLESAYRNVLPLINSNAVKKNKVPQQLKTPQQMLASAKAIHAQNPQLSLKQVAIESYKQEYGLENLELLLENLTPDCGAD